MLRNEASVRELFYQPVPANQPSTNELMNQ